MVHWKEHIVVLLLIFAIASIFLIFPDNITNIIIGNKITSLLVLENSSVGSNNTKITININEIIPPGKPITGTINIDFEKLNYDTELSIYIDNKKKYSEKLGVILDENDISYASLPGKYEKIGVGKLAISTNNIAGVELSDFLKPGLSNVKVSGNGEHLILDVGADKSVDWQYKGPFKSWSQFIFPEGIDSSIKLSPTTEILFGGHSNEKCEDIYVELDELYDIEELQITVNTKTGNDYSGIPYLTASIAGQGQCTPVPEPTNSFTQSQCQIVLDGATSGTYHVCVYTSAGVNSLRYYEVPVKDLASGPYYFMALQKPVYDTRFEGEISISGEKLENAINDFLTNCEFFPCLVPLSFNTSSQITLSDLNFVTINDRIQREFFNLKYNLPTLIEGVNVPIEIFAVLTPTEIDNSHEIKVIIDGVSQNKIFTVKDIPSAQFQVSTSRPNLLEEVIFDAKSSTSAKDGQIITYTWDFGDGVTITTEHPSISHIYYTLGKKTIILKVKDNINQISPEYKFDVIVGFDAKTLSEAIELTEQTLDRSQQYFTTYSNELIKNIYNSQGYKDKTDQAIKEIEIIKTQYESVVGDITLSTEEKETQLQGLAQKLYDLHSKIPTDIVYEEIVFDQYVDYLDIPDPKYFKSDILEPTNYKIAIVEYQDRLDVDSTGLRLTIHYYSGNKESFRAVNKKISTFENPNYIVEVVPGNIKSFITTGGTNIAPRIIQYNGDIREITYILDDGPLSELNNAKTIAIPDLSLVSEGILKPVCGNDLCEVNPQYNFDERSQADGQYYCPSDCKRGKFNYFWLILIFVIVVGGIYYINFYKGPYNFREVTNKIAIKLFKKRIFTSQKDLVNLRTYVKTALQRGYSQDQIKSVLIAKGWGQDHIGYAFELVEKNQQIPKKPLKLE